MLVEIGSGLLDWPHFEATSERYGFILLVHPRSGVPQQLSGLECAGRFGRLFAVVVELREGTVALLRGRNGSSENAAIGESVDLGFGRLVFHVRSVGLKPLRKQRTLWLRVHSLFLLRRHRVVLYFEPVEQ